MISGPLLVQVTGRRQPPSSMDEVGGHGDTALNIELVGVKAALDAVVAYERSVGFYYQTFPKIEPEELESLIALSLSTKIVDVEDTLIHQVRWQELLVDLMHSPLPESSSDSEETSELAASSSSIGDSLLHSTSTLSSLDLTSSEGSLESQPMPSTPRAKSSLHHSIEVKDTSPTGSIRISPNRSLSALASSFIPTSSRSSSNDNPPFLQEPSRTAPKHSSFADFVFPSLNPSMSASTSSTSARLKKDSEGFFSEESSNATPTSLLPSFLQESSQRSIRSRKSRTREIVDRLRSESVPNEERACNLHKGRNAVSPKYASYSPSPQLLDDFALSLIKPRRSVSEDGSGEQRQHRQTVSMTSFSASASASTSTSRLSTPEMEDDDGWIDIGDPTTSRSSPDDKSKRTRELFLALTRRRTDSVSSDVLKEMVNQSTTQACEGATAPAEEYTEMSILSRPSPSTPPRTDIIRSMPVSPSIARTGTVTSNDGWIETSSIVHEKSPKKEKTLKKETHYRKKSQNHNPGHNSFPLWARNSAFQSSMPPHPLHPPTLPLSPFPPSSVATAFSHPSALGPHLMPAPTATPAPGPGAMPYFFPSYPNLPLSVRIPPVSSANYSTAAYNTMHIPNAYPMPPPPVPVPLQPFLAAPPPFSGPGGYVHTSPVSTAVKTSGFTTAHQNTINTTSMPVPPVPVGAGYIGLNGGKGKW